jgi:hypothetical protein
MDNSLTQDDLNVIIESLNYTRLKFENYEYPSYEMKQQRLNEVNAVVAKVKELKKSS